jgi:hypothetical protein
MLSLAMAFGRICGVESEHGVGLSKLRVGFHGLANRFDATGHVEQIEFVMYAFFVEAACFVGLCGDWNCVGCWRSHCGIRAGRGWS